MKRTLALLLLALFAPLLAACAGGTEEPASASDGMLSFYYRQSALQYDSQTGVVSSELRAFSVDDPIENWLPVYLRGPASSELASPFPPAVRVLEAERDGACVRVVLSEAYDKLVGVDRTIANACLTFTLSQLEDVESVRIETEGDAVGTQDAALFTAADFAGFDYASDADEVSLSVYYSDRSFRYLLSVTTQVDSSYGDHLPDYVIGRLIEGPSDDAMRAVMPEGTQLLSSTTDSGVCTLNFNAAFYDNRPESEAVERVLINSIVNSVTGLTGVDAVRFEIEGEPAGMYRYLDLSLTYTFNDAAVGPVREAVNEFDGTIYLSGADQAHLAAVPVRVRLGTGQSKEEALMLALLTAQLPTGLDNPIPAGTKLRSVSTDGSVCRVDLSEEFKKAEDVAAMHAVVLTLASLPDISRVQILVEGELRTSILLPSKAWGYANP